MSETIVKKFESIKDLFSDIFSDMTQHMIDQVNHIVLNENNQKLQVSTDIKSVSGKDTKDAVVLSFDEANNMSLVSKENNQIAGCIDQMKVKEIEYIKEIADDHVYESISFSTAQPNQYKLEMVLNPKLTYGLTKTAI